MVKRSTPQATIDDRCYPVRMLILVPEEGFGALLGVGPGSIRHWLDQEVGRGHYAWHGGGRSFGTLIRDQVALYFRHPAHGARLLEAFPQLELADHTDNRHYTSPMRRA